MTMVRQMMALGWGEGAGNRTVWNTRRKKGAAARSSVWEREHREAHLPWGWGWGFSQKTWRQTGRWNNKEQSAFQQGLPVAGLQRARRKEGKAVAETQLGL